MRQEDRTDIKDAFVKGAVAGQFYMGQRLGYYLLDVEERHLDPEERDHLIVNAQAIYEMLHMRKTKTGG